MSTKIAENILESLSIIANNAISKSSNDKTIECEIVKVQDSSKGLYTVQYTENKFTAIASNGLVYEIGDSVYVLIPEGDFSKNKIILGNTKAVRSHYQRDEEEEKISQNKKYYNEISENFLGNLEEVNLCTYHTEEKEIEYNANLLSDIIKNYQFFVLKADFRTNIIELAQRANGNYGLKISIPAIDLDGTEFVVEKVLDITKMNGNVYNFEKYITQSIYFDFYGGLIDPNKPIKLSAFVKNFIQDDDETIPADIFIKDITFKAVEILTDEDLEGYYLSVDVTEGYYFLNGKYEADKILTPKLLVDGKSVKIEKYDCYWFKEDSSIDIDNDQYYNVYGGRGWRILNPKTQTDIDKNGNVIYNFDTTIYTQTVQRADILKKARYKVILVDPNNVLQKIVTIEDLNSGIDFSLDTPTGLTSFVANAGLSVTLIATLTYPTSVESFSFDYVFQRYDKNGEYLDNDFYNRISWDVVEENKRITKITFPVALIEDMNIIKCDFIQKQIVNDEIITKSIGIATISLTTGNQLYDYYMIVPNDNVLFKYDTNGNSPLVANYDGPYQSKLIEIEPISFNLSKNNGDEFDADEYSNTYVTWKFPKNSMLEPEGYDLKKLESDDNFYYIKGKGLRKLSYKIKELFNNNLVDNTIFISVLFDNTEIQGKATINIIKDGKSGTNGSQYAAIITHNNYAYEEKDPNGVPQKARVIYTNKWQTYRDKTLINFNSNNYQFDVKVYKNGVVISSEKYNVDWTMFDPDTLDSTFSINRDGKLSLEKNTWGDNEIPVNIVQATIRIKESSDISTGEEILYAYYPIDIVKLSGDNIFIPDISKGYSSVEYSPDGTNPQYNTNDPFEINVIDGVNKYYDCTWSTSDNHNLIKEEDVQVEFDQYKCKPISQYINGQSKNYISATLIQTNDQIAGLNQEFTNLTNEMINLNDKIQFYTNEKSILQNILQSFSYDHFSRILNSCEEYLTYRAKYLFVLKNLIQILNKINDIDKTFDFTYIKSDINEIIESIYTASTPEDIQCYDTTLSISSENPEIIILINDFNEKIEESILTCGDLIMYINLEEELNSYNSLFSDLENLILILEELSSPHDNNIPDQSFVNLKNMVNIYKNYLTNSEKEYTKIWIEQNVFKEIDNLFLKYRDYSYIQKEYDEKIDTLSLKYTDAQKQLEKVSRSYLTRAVVIKPILFLLNRYSLNSINGWDGNKLYTGKDNEYLLAPQIGAGKKNNGLFTGMVMGIKKEFDNNNFEKTKIGLMGFKDGQESIFLDSETGRATFGAAGQGQIIMDPDPSKNSQIAGWTINEKELTNDQGYGKVSLYSGQKGVDGKAIAVENGNSHIFLNYDGSLVANNATIEGNITAKDGTFGGWHLKEHSLNSDDDEIILHSQNKSIKVGGITIISNGDGNIRPPCIYSHDAPWDPHKWAYADKGFHISEDAFFVGGDGAYFLFDANADLGNGETGSKLTVHGRIEATEGVFHGRVEATDGYFNNLVIGEGAKIGDWTIQGGDLYSDDGTHGRIAIIGKYEDRWGGAAIAVDRGNDHVWIKYDGSFYANKVTVDGGTIGGWHLNGNSIYSNDNAITLRNDEKYIQVGSSPNIMINANHPNGPAIYSTGIGNGCYWDPSDYAWYDTGFFLSNNTFFVGNGNTGQGTANYILYNNNQHKLTVKGELQAGDLVIDNSGIMSIKNSTGTGLTIRTYETVGGMPVGKVGIATGRTTGDENSADFVWLTGCHNPINDSYKNNLLGVATSKDDYGCHGHIVCGTLYYRNLVKINK